MAAALVVISAFGGVRVSPHTFWHTFGLGWITGNGENEGDTLSLRRLMGDSTPAMCSKYVRLVTQDWSCRCLLGDKVHGRSITKGMLSRLAGGKVR